MNGNSQKRLIPCLVRSLSGKTITELIKGEKSQSMAPDWRCIDWVCPLRGIKGETYGDLKVVLGTRDSQHGVIFCESAGGTGRKEMV